MTFFDAGVISLHRTDVGPTALRRHVPAGALGSTKIRARLFKASLA